MYIIKFGGTSMGDAQTWQRVLDIITRYERPFVIVSATARTTRKLVAAAHEAVNDLERARTSTEEIKTRHKELIKNFLNHYQKNKSPLAQNCNWWIDQTIKELDSCLSKIHDEQRVTALTKDAVAAVGEQLSSYLFAQCGTAAGLSTTWIDAKNVIRTDSEFGQAAPNTDFINREVASLMEKLDNNLIPVMGGYYGRDENGFTTTLGFEGSDYTASLIGAALSAEAIEIWTDVSGIYTCDPRLIPNAKPIPELSFQEATELAYFGAKVLHPSTTKPASRNEIPVWVKNIFEIEKPGTCISSKAVSNGRVKAMTYKEDCVVITVTSSQTVMGYEFLGGVFDILNQYRLPVDVVTTTEASVSIAIENSNRVTEAAEELRTLGKVDLLGNQGIISFVGCRESSAQTLMNDILTHIDPPSVNLISFSQSKGNLNIVLAKEKVTRSVKAIHKQIF